METVYILQHWARDDFREVYDNEQEAEEAAWASWYAECSKDCDPIAIFKFAISLNRTLSIGDYYIQKVRASL